jgi:hypothetical protein
VNPGKENADSGKESPYILKTQDLSEVNYRIACGIRRYRMYISTFIRYTFSLKLTGTSSLKEIYLYWIKMQTFAETIPKKKFQ